MLSVIAIKAQGFQPSSKGHLDVVFGSIDAEELFTFWFSSDTMTLAPVDDVVAFGLKACANNTGQIYLEGKKTTIDGIETDQIGFYAGETFNGGLLIQVSDSITIWSATEADTCIVSLILR